MSVRCTFCREKRLCHSCHKHLKQCGLKVEKKESAGWLKKVQKEMLSMQSKLDLIEGVRFKGSAIDAMGEMFRSGFKSDVILVCGGTRFPCHQAILSMRSDYFKTLFNNHSFKDVKDREIVIEEVYPNVLKVILDHIYSDRTNVQLTTDMMFEIYQAADRFMFTFLKDRIANAMMKMTTKENAAHILSLFLSHNTDKKLIEKVTEIVQKNIVEISKTKAFASLMAQHSEALLEFAKEPNLS